MDHEELLSHAEFVRSLTRSLVLDDHRAADIVQETFLAALKHPPSREKPLRSWLATVARNFARRMHRGERRLKNREGFAAPPEQVLSPEEVAIREETLRVVTDAVFRLDEPYRTAILLRYFDDLSVQEIADRIGSPLGAVKARLKRGLDLMRARLDAWSGGERK